MDKKEIDCYILAGKIAAEAVKYGKSIIKKDMLLVDIANKIEGKIMELGGGLAFPVNLCINEIAAHYTPSSNDKTTASGLLSVDLGVDVEGFIADTAFSVDLEGEHGEMVKLNEKILLETLKEIKPGIKVNMIGKTIQEQLDGNKYMIIRNLSGHALGENVIHAGLTISNIENTNETSLKDIAIAIEPFLTTGIGEIYESSPSEIFMLSSSGVTRDRDARKILEFIKENYKTKPFCKRWLEKSGFQKVGFSLSQMTKQGILHNFPVLVEKSKKPVSQFEHTVLISEKAIITTL